MPSAKRTSSGRAAKSHYNGGTTAQDAAAASRAVPVQYARQAGMGARQDRHLAGYQQPQGAGFQSHGGGAVYRGPVNGGHNPMCDDQSEHRLPRTKRSSRGRAAQDTAAANPGVPVENTGQAGMGARQDWHLAGYSQPQGAGFQSHGGGAAYGGPGYDGHEPMCDDQSEQAMSREVAASTRLQVQMQLQAGRDAQTSCQMVYDVLKWTIGSIEIMEYLECSENPSSRPSLSDVSKTMHQTMKEKRKKGDKVTMKEMAERCNTYLVLMEAQMKSCNQAIREPVRFELRAIVAAWEKTGLQNESLASHHFKAQLIRVIEGYKPELLPIPSEDIEPNADLMGGFFQGVQGGLKVGDALEEKFRRDPTKRATLPQFRTSESYR